MPFFCVITVITNNINCLDFSLWTWITWIACIVYALWTVELWREASSSTEYLVVPTLVPTYVASGRKHIL